MQEFVSLVLLSFFLCHADMDELLLLFSISFLAATISGAAGFGGALVLLLVLTGIVGIKAAAPILIIRQIFGNTSRV